MYCVYATHEGNRNAYRIFVGKPEGKDLLQMCRLIWDYNTKMDLKDMEWEVVDFIHVTQDID